MTLADELKRRAAAALEESLATTAKQKKYLDEYLVEHTDEMAGEMLEKAKKELREFVTANPTQVSYLFKVEAIAIPDQILEAFQEMLVNKLIVKLAAEGIRVETRHKSSFGTSTDAARVGEDAAPSFASTPLVLTWASE